MSFWAFCLLLLGVLVVTNQLFRLIELIERPVSRRSRRGVRHAA